VVEDTSTTEVETGEMTLVAEMVGVGAAEMEIMRAKMVATNGTTEETVAAIVDIVEEIAVTLGAAVAATGVVTAGVAGTAVGIETMRGAPPATTTAGRCPRRTTGPSHWPGTSEWSWNSLALATPALTSTNMRTSQWMLLEKMCRPILTTFRISR